MGARIVHINKVRAFSIPDDNRSFSVVRVQTAVLDELGGRGHWIRIKKPEKSVCIYRIVKASKPSQGFDKSSLEMDYDSKSELDLKDKNSPDERGFYYVDLQLSKATLVGILLGHWRNPEPGYRLAFRISVLSLVLAILGIFS